MRASTSTKPALSTSTSGVRTTTVFTSGNSQAVRLPKEFRFNSKLVSIERRGDEIVLREKPVSLGQTLAELFAGLPPITDEEFREFQEAMAVVKDRRPPQERDFSWMSEPTKPVTKKSRRKA